MFFLLFLSLSLSPSLSLKFALNIGTTRTTCHAHIVVARIMESSCVNSVTRSSRKWFPFCYASHSSVNRSICRVAKTAVVFTLHHVTVNPIFGTLNNSSAKPVCALKQKFLFIYFSCSIKKVLNKLCMPDWMRSLVRNVEISMDLKVRFCRRVASIFSQYSIKWFVVVKYCSIC